MRQHASAPGLSGIRSTRRAVFQCGHGGAVSGQVARADEPECAGERRGDGLLGAGDALLDTVAFFPQTTDYSLGRDGTGALISDSCVCRWPGRWRAPRKLIQAL